MPLLNTANRYGFVSKTFHWVMGISIIGMLAMGLYMEGLPASSPEMADFKMQLYGFHKGLGAVLLLAAVLRALWWLAETKPRMARTLPAWSHRWVSLGHSALYAFMVLMPLSGWLMSNAAGRGVSVFGWFDLPVLIAQDDGLRGVFGAMHTFAAYALIAMLAAHVGAALLHHFWFRDDTLRKMLPFGK